MIDTGTVGAFHHQAVADAEVRISSELGSARKGLGARVSPTDSNPHHLGRGYKILTGGDESEEEVVRAAKRAAKCCRSAPLQHVRPKLQPTKSLVDAAVYDFQRIPKPVSSRGHPAQSVARRSSRATRCRTCCKPSRFAAWRRLRARPETGASATSARRVPLAVDVAAPDLWLLSGLAEVFEVGAVSEGGPASVGRAG